KLVASPTQRQDARRSGADVQCAHPRMDQLLWSVLPVGSLPDLTAHRRLSGAMGRSEVQVLAQAQDAGDPLAATHRAPPDRPVRALAPAVWTRPNNGSRMTRERHVRFCESAAVRFRRATHPIVHCRSKEEARSVLEAIRGRFAECGLELHPEKTRIVYCKEHGRPGSHEHIKFDFLGYAFQPRRAKNRWGKYFIGFLPAISTKAAKAIRQTIREWRMASTRNN